MSTLEQTKADIGRRMRRGDTFAAVENEVIDPSTLSEAEKAALWLYGWSFVNWRRQRREAVAHIELLARGETAEERAPARFRLAELRLAP